MPRIHREGWQRRAHRRAHNTDPTLMPGRQPTVLQQQPSHTWSPWTRHRASSQTACSTCLGGHSGSARPPARSSPSGPRSQRRTRSRRRSWPAHLWRVEGIAVGGRPHETSSGAAPHAGRGSAAGPPPPPTPNLGPMAPESWEKTHSRKPTSTTGECPMSGKGRSYLLMVPGCVQLGGARVGHTKLLPRRRAGPILQRRPCHPSPHSVPFPYTSPPPSPFQPPNKAPHRAG